MAFGLILTSATLIGATTMGRAAGSEASTRAVGVWDLKLDTGSRQCRLMLRDESMPPGYAIGMPPGCRSAFRFMSDVKMWADVGDGRLMLDDAAGQPVLIFTPGDDGVLSAVGPEGEALRLSALGPHPEVLLKGGAVARDHALASQPTMRAAPVATAKGSVTPPPVVPKPRMPSVTEMAGHYSVLRKLGKDTGCMVTFDERAAGPGGSLKANLAPACRDQGIMIFDPVGWRLQAGRLVLTARKGHTTTLDLQGDGSWAKDPKDGAGMSLKKM